MNIEQIKYFLEIAKTGSLMEAAKNLHITQPTLSRQMTHIEEELNMQIFYRTNHGMKLTPSGHVLFNEWTKTLDVYEKSISKALSAFKGIKGSLSIGILDGLKIGEKFPKFLEYMKDNYPNIEVTLERLSFNNITDKLSHNELDIAISLDVNFLRKTNLILRNIRSYEPAIAVPKTNPLSKKKNPSIEDFRDEDFAIVDKSECVEGVNVIVDVCKKYGDFLPNLYFVPSMANVLLWLESGCKCALLNMEMQIADNPNIKMIKMPYDTSEHYVQMAYNVKNENFALKIMEDYYLA